MAIVLHAARLFEYRFNGGDIGSLKEIGRRRGDGASIGADYRVVPDFGAHLQYMTGFHKRYMVANRIMRLWADMVRPLDIEIIAPQHGALFKGKEMVAQFIDWCADLECGVDLVSPLFKLPAA